MKCPNCSGATIVKDSRTPKRRRKCLSCGYAFSTEEITADELDALRAGSTYKRDRAALLLIIRKLKDLV